MSSLSNWYTRLCSRINLQVFTTDPLTLSIYILKIEDVILSTSVELKKQTIFSETIFFFSLFLYSAVLLFSPKVNPLRKNYLGDGDGGRQSRREWRHLQKIKTHCVPPNEMITTKQPFLHPSIRLRAEFQQARMI